MTYSVTQKASYKEKKYHAYKIPDFAVHEMGSLHNPVIWYKIAYAGEQVVHWNFQNNATPTRTAQPGFVLEVLLCNLILYHVTGSFKETIAKKSHAYNNNPPLPPSKLHGPSLRSVDSRCVKIMHCGHSTHTNCVDSMAIKVSCCKTKILNK